MPCFHAIIIFNINNFHFVEIYLNIKNERKKIMEYNHLVQHFFFKAITFVWQPGSTFIRQMSIISAYSLFLGLIVISHAKEKVPLDSKTKGAFLNFTGFDEESPMFMLKPTSYIGKFLGCFTKSYQIYFFLVFVKIDCFV